MNPQKPYFSVITPTYNRANYIVTAIESVLAQTFREFELIIVDDGSKDETESLVAPILKSDPRVHYIKQENKGRSVARNVGIDAASGEYVCFLDSDDFWRNNHLDTFKTAIRANKEGGLFVTQLTWWKEAQNLEEKVVYREKQEFSSDVEFVIANEFAPNCVCVSTYILKKHRFSPELFINEDLELWARIAAENPVYLLSTNTAVLRVHPGNTMTSEKDSITPRIEVFNKQLATPSVKSLLSDGFIKNRQRSLHEHLVRHLAETADRWRFVWESVRFVAKYPSQSGNSAKIVSVIYALPVGFILKRLIQGSKGGK